MFLTCTLIDTVPVAAANLAKPTAKAILEILEELYLDKVIPDLGLAVSVYNVLEIKGGFVYPSDSAAYFEVSFELVVFRPVKGEVFVGRSHTAERYFSKQPALSAACFCQIASEIGQTAWLIKLAIIQGRRACHAGLFLGYLCSRVQHAAAIALQ